MPMAQDTMLETLYVIMRDVLMFLARYETVAGARFYLINRNHLLGFWNSTEVCKCLKMSLLL